MKPPLSPEPTSPYTASRPDEPQLVRVGGFVVSHYVGVTCYPTLVCLAVDTFGWGGSFGESVCKGLRSV